MRLSVVVRLRLAVGFSYKMTKQCKPILFLPVESTPRELDYKLNIARHFCQAGFDVMIGNPPFLRDELKYKNFKGIFLEKGMNPDPEYYQALIKKGIKVFCLSDEGAAVPAFSVTYPAAIQTLKLAERIFMWGQCQVDDLIKRNSDKELSDKYMVTGYPSFDLCLNKYKKYHQKLRPKTLGEGYILINSNFASVNGYSIEETLEGCPDMSPETLEAIKNTYANESKKFDSFKKWLLKISEIFPDETFIIRPHPVEKEDGYQELIRANPTFRICRDGNANQAISGAKLVLHNDCTTALQSYLMGVPVISLSKSNDEPVHAEWALAFGTLPATIDEAIDFVKSVVETGAFDKKTQNEIDKRAKTVQDRWFANIGNSTSQIVATMLKSWLTVVSDNEYIQIRDQRTFIQKIKKIIRSYLPLHYKVPIISRIPLSKFEKTDVLTRIKLLDEIDSVSCHYNVKKLYPNTFLISVEK